MQIKMTSEIQAELLERLKTTVGNSVAESLTLLIFAESLTAENTRLKEEISELKIKLELQQNNKDN